MTRSSGGCPHPTSERDPLWRTPVTWWPVCVRGLGVRNRCGHRGAVGAVDRLVTVSRLAHGHRPRRTLALATTSTRPSPTLVNDLCHHPTVQPRGPSPVERPGPGCRLRSHRPARATAAPRSLRRDLAVVLGERPADRLDSAEAVPVLVDERYERRCGRSSPAAKKLAAALRISLARPSSAISFVIALIRAGLLAGRARTLPGADLAPAHPVTQRLGGTDAEFSATAHNAADSFGWSPRTSATMRTARRRNSDGWEEGRDMTRNRVPTEPNPGRFNPDVTRAAPLAPCGHSSRLDGRRTSSGTVSASGEPNRRPAWATA